VLHFLWQGAGGRAARQGRAGGQDRTGQGRGGTAGQGGQGRVRLSVCLSCRAGQGRAGQGPNEE
jgi:hypothetical protein